MSEQYAVDLGDDENPYDVVLEKGKQQGLEQGRAALLFVAKGVLAETELRYFEKRPVSSELLDELRETIAERLATAS